MEKGFYLKSKLKQSPKLEKPPLPAAVKLPVKTDSDSAYDINEIGRNDSGFDFELNRKNILQGIIFAEVFGKPKGSRRYRK